MFCCLATKFGFRVHNAILLEYRPPAPKLRKWLMRKYKCTLPGLKLRLYNHYTWEISIPENDSEGIVVNQTSPSPFVRDGHIYVST